MSILTIQLAEYSKESASIQAIRKAVFQEEQGVDRALDFDGLDETSAQIVAYLDKQPVGTARMRNLDKKIVKIERLAVLPHARGQGIAKKITEKALEIAAANNIREVVVHAQEYVKGLYEKLGFVEVGEKFTEAGIAHIKMKKKLPE